MEELKCPNCGSAVAKDGDKFVCASCGGSFAFTAGEAKLQNVGDFDALKADVEELKKRLPASTPAAAPAETEPAEEDDQAGDQAEDDDEEDL